MNAKSEVAARVILLAFGLIAGLAIMELAMRLLGESSEVGDLRGLHQLRLDRPWLYGLRAGADGVMQETGEVRYRVNADGFRGRRYARPKPLRTFRVLVLGDSISFGYGVEEEQTFSHVMEARLQRLVRDRTVEVVNLGVGGYNPFNELALLADVGASYQPDLVLVQFCINDLNDPTLHFDWQTRIHLATIPDAAFPDPSLRRVAAARPWPLLRACRRSKLCSLVDRLLLAATEPEPEMEELRAAVMPIEDTGAPEWDWLEAHYLEMAKESARMGAGFAVLAFPYVEQTAGPYPHPVEQGLLALGRRHGWPTVDLLTAFRRAGGALFLDLWHPAPAGHRLTARATLHELACTGLLPPQALALRARHPCE